MFTQVSDLTGATVGAIGAILESRTNASNNNENLIMRISLHPYH